MSAIRMNVFFHKIASVVKTAIPRHVRRRLQAARWRFALRRRATGKPFRFNVAEPQSRHVLNCCIAYNRHGAYCVPASGLHRPAALVVLAGDVWEEPTIDLIVSHCWNGDIVHAGAFFGDFLPALAAAASRVGNRVWAFEPSPESYRCAAITLRLNQIDNVTLMNAALGEQSGRRELVTQSGRVALGGASHIAGGRNGPELRRAQTTPVEIVTIDDVVSEDRSVSVIQLDVEGYEERALTGAMRTIRRRQPLLILETIPSEVWVSENLSPLGYRVAGTVFENTVLRTDWAK
jgi:FkbM family methyltransferase